jgi:ribosomal protein S18 acetylase RimI-like enzyme
MKISFRKTQLSDINWIINLTENDAKLGHYLTYPTKEEMMRGETMRLTSIVNYGLSPQTPPRPAFLAGSLVCEKISIAGKVKAGFSIYQKAVFPSGYSANEIHELSILPIFREKKVGSRLLDYTIELLSTEDSAIYGRCIPASKTMIEMLRKRDFELVAERTDLTMYFVKGTAEQREEFKSLIRYLLGNMLKK